jgi:ABC-type uncharacterized transport system substrate-binding protein
MRRREFIRLVSGAAVSWPIAARSQQPTAPVIGFLSGTHLADREIAAVKQGLAEANYIEGRNVLIEHRSAEGQYDRLPSLAADLVQHQVTVIIAIGGTVTALAAKAATQTIPIVFATAGDPVRLKLVASLSRPGGNVTGVSFLGTGLAPKRLQLLHDLTPTAKTIGYLVNPLNPNSKTEASEVQTAARSLGQQVYVQNASNDRGIDAAFANFGKEQIKTLIVAADAVFTRRREQLVALAARNAIAAVYALPQFVTAGGLMSYGASRLDAFRLVGVYAGTILKGGKPAEIPVQQAVKIELVINLKTAKALGLTVPHDLLASADQLIE